MSKKKNTKKRLEKPIDFNSGYNEWHLEWKIEDRDLIIGKKLITEFTPFIQSLIDSGLSEKTIRNHMHNLFLLGAEIINRINEEDGSYRKLQINEILAKYIDEDSGPLLHFWDPNNPTEESYLKAFDSTCRKLHKFNTPPV